MVSTMPRTKQRTPEMRERVLAEAVELLASAGVSGFTTRKVAERAKTSTPAVYELFGGKGGLVREVFFEGFRRLGTSFRACESTGDARQDLLDLASAFRRFANENPVMFELMFANPFTDFAPGPSEVDAGQSVAAEIVKRIKACIEAGLLEGDAIDIAHVLMSTCHGLAAAESTGRLGGTRKATDRRWRLAVDSMVQGLRPALSVNRGQGQG